MADVAAAAAREARKYHGEGLVKLREGGVASS